MGLSSSDKLPDTTHGPILQTDSWRLYLAAFFSGLVSTILYAPSAGFDFVNFDDYAYIYSNPFLGRPDWSFIQWAFTTFRHFNWHPLTWLSYALDFSLWGAGPRGFHVTNIVLHGLNTALVVLVLRRLFLLADWNSRIRSTGAAILCGLMFGLHPVHVESVAWISERKDVLFALFYLLSLQAYLRFAAGQERGRGIAYGLSLAFFALSLLSKPMAVSLPLVLVILDVFPLRRLSDAVTLWRKGILEKLPFLALSIVSSMVTVAAQGEGVIDTGLIPFSERMVVALRAVGFYLWKCVVPTGLSPLYPRPESISPVAGDVPAYASLALIALGVAVFRGRQIPVLAAGFGFFLVSLFPVLGLVHVGAHLAADRYLYLPVLGPIVIIVVSGFRLVEKRPALKSTGAVLSLILLLAFGVATVIQARNWTDSEKLWSSVLVLHPDTPTALEGRALARLDKGRGIEALEDLNRAVTIESRRGSGLNQLHRYLYDRALVHRSLKDERSALEDLSEAIRLYDKQPDYFVERADMSAGAGNHGEAIADFRIAVNLDPAHVRALNGLGQSLLADGRSHQEALDAFTRAIALKPGEGGLYLNRGNVYFEAGQISRALEEYKIAARLGFEPARRYLSSKEIAW